MPKRSRVSMQSGIPLQSSFQYSSHQPKHAMTSRINGPFDPDFLYEPSKGSHLRLRSHRSPYHQFRDLNDQVSARSSQAATNAQAKPSTLESLPWEIRTNIYKHFFTDLEFYVHDPKFECSHKPDSRPLIQGPLGVLLTSRAIKEDAEPIFYDFAILNVCPCFLCRTETHDFEAMLGGMAKQRLQPLLKLWELRRTVQSFDIKFRLYSGLQQIELSYANPYVSSAGLTNWGSLSFAYLVSHTRKQKLSIWLRIPYCPDESRDIISIKVDSTDLITIVAKNRSQGLEASKYLLEMKHWLLVGSAWFTAKEQVVLDKTNTKFDIIEIDHTEDDWLQRYRYECMNGRKAALKKFGRHA